MILLALMAAVAQQSAGQQAAGQQAAGQQPQFFDPPSFIVAGVTDSSQRGGHGSDPVLHSTNAMIKALGTPSETGDALAAVRAAQRAAEQDPSEAHLFEWGAELLRHRALPQAAEVFRRGKSVRMLLGLAVASYAQASYGEAARCFFEAADVNPQDAAPYLVMGQARNSPVGQAPGFGERMERFARLHPENAWANYYLGTEAALKRAVEIDPGLEDGWLQLGVLYADRGEMPLAVAAWKKALNRAESHYRLARAYRQAGDAAASQTELATYEQMSRKAAADEESERNRIPEFVFSLR